MFPGLKAERSSRSPSGSPPSSCRWRSNVHDLTAGVAAASMAFVEVDPRRDDGWRTAGSMSKTAAFSFYPGMNLGACGEGGAVTTDDEDIAQRVLVLRDHGSRRISATDRYGAIDVAVPRDRRPSRLR